MKDGLVYGFGIDGVSFAFEYETDRISYLKNSKTIVFFQCCRNMHEFKETQSKTHKLFVSPD